MRAFFLLCICFVLSAPSALMADTVDAGESGTTAHDELGDKARKGLGGNSGFTKKLDNTAGIIDEGNDGSVAASGSRGSVHFYNPFLGATALGHAAYSDTAKEATELSPGGVRQATIALTDPAIAEAGAVHDERVRSYTNSIMDSHFFTLRTLATQPGGQRLIDQINGCINRQIRDGRSFVTAIPSCHGTGRTAALLRVPGEAEPDASAPHRPGDDPDDTDPGRDIRTGCTDFRAMGGGWNSCYVRSVMEELFRSVANTDRRKRLQCTFKAHYGDVYLYDPPITDLDPAAADVAEQAGARAMQTKRLSHFIDSQAGTTRTCHGTNLYNTNSVSGLVPRLYKSTEEIYGTIITLVKGQCEWANRIEAHNNSNSPFRRRPNLWDCSPVNAGLNTTSRECGMNLPTFDDTDYWPEPRFYRTTDASATPPPIKYRTLLGNLSSSGTRVSEHPATLFFELWKKSARAREQTADPDQITGDTNQLDCNSLLTGAKISDIVDYEYFSLISGETGGVASHRMRFGDDESELGLKSDVAPHLVRYFRYARLIAQLRSLREVQAALQFIHRYRAAAGSDTIYDQARGLIAASLNADPRSIENIIPETAYNLNRELQEFWRNIDDELSDRGVGNNLRGVFRARTSRGTGVQN